jgi:hypothetical protein
VAGKLPRVSAAACHIRDGSAEPTSPPAGVRVTVSPARLLAFFRELAADGNMNAGTASLHQTAVRKMFADHPQGQEVPLDELDVGALFAALRKREGRRVKTATLETYRTTFERAIELYRLWDGTRREDRPADLLRRRRERRFNTAATGPMFEHVLPLAPSRLAELRLPADLTTAEARRLARFVEALASDDEPAVPTSMAVGRRRPAARPAPAAIER